MKYYIAVVLCFSILFASAQVDTSKLRERDDLARQKLAGFSTSLSENNMRSFGFTSMDDVRNASLGTPIEMAMVRLDDLKNYTSATNANALLIRLPKYLFPIVNKNSQQTVNAMTVTKPGSQWTIVSMGRDKETAIIAYNRIKAEPGHRFVLTAIPPFNFNFLVYPATNGSLMMIPLVSDQQNNIKAGETLPATKIFEIYSALAKRYNGQPM